MTRKSEPMVTIIAVTGVCSTVSDIGKDIIRAGFCVISQE